MKTIFSQALVIARRDFMAIVGTPTFLLFLLAPFFMLAVSAGMGMSVGSMAAKSEGPMRIVVLADGAQAERILAADRALRPLFRRGEAPPMLEVRKPERDLSAQAEALFAAGEIDTRAIMFGAQTAPRIRYVRPSERHAAYLAELAEQASVGEKAALLPGAALSKPVLSATTAARPDGATRQASGFGAIFGIFLLTLVLAGQTVGSLAEEKANKVIEILAASIRLEAVFLGKLFGMLGVSIVFIAFWAVFIAAGVQFLPAQALQSFQPAVGLLPFVALAIAYFTTAFLLLGAIFLGVGAQANTVREIQMLSLPITIFQVAMFGLSSAAAADPGSSLATFARIFPFSSPFAMAARGANDPALWPHALALAWQALWVALTIAFGSRLFRLGVLKAGGGWRGVVGLRPAH